MKNLFVLILLLFAVNSYSQRYSYSYPRLELSTPYDTIKKSSIDSAGYYFLGTSYNDVIMHIRNITGANSDTFKVAMKSYYNGVFKDSILLSGWNMLTDNSTLISTFIVPAGQSRAFQLNYPFADRIYYWRTNPYESGNKDIIYFELGNSNK